MSDQLKWMNQHMVLLKYRTVGELVTSGGYKLPPQYIDAVQNDQFVADFIQKLIDAGAVRTAVNVLAYAIHRRAGVWWGLCCMRDLIGELKEGIQLRAEQEKKVRQEEEKAAAARAEEAKKKAEEEAAREKEAEEFRKKNEKEAAAALAKLQEVKNKFTDEQKKIYAEVMQKVDDECIKATGMPLQDFIRSMTDEGKAAAPKPEAAPKAPAPEPEAAPKAPAQADIADDMALPPAMRQMLKEKALAVVNSWVEDPTAEHSVQAEKISELIENEPEGMLARTAFWSYGNLAVAEPDGTNVPVPPGLAGNGLRAALLMAMLAQGGTRSLAERAEKYLAIGFEVVCGKNNWTVSDGSPAGASSAAEPEVKDIPYRKWK